MMDDYISFSVTFRGVAPSFRASALGNWALLAHGCRMTGTEFQEAKLCFRLEIYHIHIDALSLAVTMISIQARREV